MSSIQHFNFNMAEFTLIPKMERHAVLIALGANYEEVLTSRGDTSFLVKKQKIILNGQTSLEVLSVFSGSRNSTFTTPACQWDSFLSTYKFRSLQSDMCCMRTWDIISARWGEGNSCRRIHDRIVFFLQTTALNNRNHLENSDTLWIISDKNNFDKDQTLTRRYDIWVSASAA